MRRIGRSYRYDSAHIPSKAEAASTPNRAVIRSKDAIIRQCYKQEESEKLQASGHQDESSKTFPSRNPSGRPCESEGDFRQENGAAAGRSDTVPQNRRQALVTKILFSSQTAPVRADAAASDNWAASRLPWAGLSIFVKRFSVGRLFSRSAARCIELRLS